MGQFPKWHAHSATRREIFTRVSSYYIMYPIEFVEADDYNNHIAEITEEGRDDADGSAAAQ